MAISEQARSPAGSDPTGDETRFRDLLDRLSQTVFELDLQGRFVYVNRTSLDTFGYTMEDVARGLTVFEMVAPGERDSLRGTMSRRLAGGNPEGHVYTALRKDGTTFPALVHTSIVEKDGRPTGIQGYLVDISERVHAENALRYRVALEQLIMRISTELVAGLGPGRLDSLITAALADIGRFMKVDRSYVFLLSADGAFVDNTHEWVAEGIRAERENLQHMPAESSLPWFTQELQRKGVVLVPDVGSLPPEAIAERKEFEREGIRSLLCVAMSHGDTPGGFLGLDAVRSRRDWSDDEIGLLRVVGEILMGAILRQRAEKALRESERKYKTLVETTLTGFVIIDDHGRVLDANANYVRMSGHHTLEEIRNRSVVEWTASHDRERNTQAVKGCMELGFVRDMQVDYAHSDGTLVPVLINATVTETEGGKQIMTLVRDISDRKRLEEELLRSEKLRSVGILAGGIAHDFNNILTAILGNISLLQATLGANSDAREHLAEAEKASQRARELTRQLLTFSRGGEPVRRPFVPDAIVRESATLALRGRATACEFRISSTLSTVDGDEGQIGQVIRNLVLNASQAMQGTGTVTVTLDERKVRAGEVHSLVAGPYVAITVTDSGSGIPEEHRSRIFDPYFTTKPDGRGLGLAVCHSIVTSHKGAITVASQPGRGSVFTVYLPIAHSAATDAPQPETPLVQGRGRVLVMDDEKNVREIAGKILRALGYDVAFAEHGREAIDLWQEARKTAAPFAAVIMDLTVAGGMGGREAIRELLAVDPEARGIVSSGYSRDPVLAKYRDFGFCEVLAKPYSVAEMGRVLSAVLRRL